MEKFQPDWIVAMGGGSPIDAAKAMWIKYEYPDCTFEDMCKVFGLPKLRRKAEDDEQISYEEVDPEQNGEGIDEVFLFRVS